MLVEEGHHQGFSTKFSTTVWIKHQHLKLNLKLFIFNSLQALYIQKRESD